MNWTEADVEAHNSARRPMQPKRSRARGVAPVEERVFDGIVYHSRSERDYAETLDTQYRCGAIKGWKRQVRIPLRVYGALVTTMVVDFEVTHIDGSVELVEVKGWQSDIFKWKLKLFKALFPDRKYTLLQVGGSARSGRKTSG